MSLFDTLQRLPFIILLLKTISLLGTPSEPANVFGNLLHQLDYFGFVFWHRSPSQAGKR